MRKQTYLIAFCIFILATGGYTAMPLFVVMTKLHGISLVQVGLLTSLYIFTQKVTPLLFGPIGDRVGHKKMACAGEFLRGAGFIGLGFFSPYPMLLAFAALAGIGGGVAGPSLKALMMLSADSAYRPKVSALRSTAVNVALVVGPGLAGLVIFLGYVRGIFLTAGVCYWVGVLLILLFTNTVSRPEAVGRLFSFSVYKEIGRNRSFLHLLIYMFMVWILFAQLFVTIPNYARLFTPHIEEMFLINGVMGILLEYPIGHLMSQSKRPEVFLPFGSVLFFLAFLAFGLIHQLIGLYVGIVLFTFGELFIFPMVETMVANLSSGDSHMAAYFGAASLSDGLGRPTGSFLGGLLFGLLPSASLGWFVLSAVGCGLLLYSFVFLKGQAF